MDLARVSRLVSECAPWLWLHINCTAMIEGTVLSTSCVKKFNYFRSSTTNDLFWLEKSGQRWGEAEWGMKPFKTKYSFSSDSCIFQACLKLIFKDIIWDFFYLQSFECFEAMRLFRFHLAGILSNIFEKMNACMWNVK